MSWIKKYLSYLYPIPDRKSYSQINGTIEINWNNGQRVIDTRSANYSYGSLQRLLKYGLKNLPSDLWTHCQEILILGVAGGSVIETLRRDFAYPGNITGVEIDPEMMRWLRTEFNIGNTFNTQIIELDANYYVYQTQKTFDLIIIDIFIDTKMPDFLFEQSFIDRVYEMLNPKGSILFNTIYHTQMHKERNQKYFEYIQTKKTIIKRLDQLDGFNEIFLITKN